MDYDFADTPIQTDRDFHKARAQEFWSTLWARVRGEPTELLNFEEVKRRLRLSDERYLGLQDIPLDNIVGSVGRYHDFTRRFLPKRSVNADRWKAVDALLYGMQGFPPIHVYKVGEAYFVLDGNHRVSVARANGLPTIEAYVTEFKTDVPFDKDTTTETLYLKEGYAYFLRETNLKALRPEADVMLTEPVNYAEILEHIAVHHYFLGLECNCQPSWKEGVASWYDKVYMPMVQAIRDHHMLEDFPDRTEADLYVWLMRHQAEIWEHYGKPASPEETIETFLTMEHEYS